MPRNYSSELFSTLGFKNIHNSGDQRCLYLFHCIQTAEYQKSTVTTALGYNNREMKVNKAVSCVHSDWHKDSKIFILNYNTVKVVRKKLLLKKHTSHQLLFQSVSAWYSNICNGTMSTSYLLVNETQLLSSKITSLSQAYYLPESVHFNFICRSTWAERMKNIRFWAPAIFSSYQ